MTTVLSLFARRRLVPIALAVLASAALAQPQPLTSSKVLTIVVSFPPGAGPDLVARAVGEKMAARLGQTVVVDNKPGTGGLVGAAAVARSTADGSTVLLTANTLATSPHVIPRSATSVDVLKDLAPVAQIASTPMLLVANPGAGIRTAQDLRAAVLRNPKPVYGSAGNGSPMHFAGAMLERSLGVDLVHVPYRGAAPVVTAALGGEVPLAFVALGGVAPHLKTGKLVAVGVAERSRSRLLPDAPTLAESGIAGVEVNAWYGVFAPAGTPAAVVARWNEELAIALNQPDVKAKLDAAGIEPGVGTPEALAATMRADHERYGRIARDHKIVAD